jgi:hypothetical protein
VSTTNHIHAAAPGHTTAIEAGEELVEVTGDGLRIVEVGVTVLLGLLVCPPLLLLAFLVAAPAMVVAALVAAVAVPTLLVRRVLAHHRAHGSTLYVHRLLRR